MDDDECWTLVNKKGGCGCLILCAVGVIAAMLVAFRIRHSWTFEPGQAPSMGCHMVGDVERPKTPKEAWNEAGDGWLRPAEKSCRKPVERAFKSCLRSDFP